MTIRIGWWAVVARVTRVLDNLFFCTIFFIYFCVCVCMCVSIIHDRQNGIDFFCVFFPTIVDELLMIVLGKFNQLNYGYSVH